MTKREIALAKRAVARLNGVSINAREPLPDAEEPKLCPEDQCIKNRYPGLKIAAARYVDAVEWGGS